MSEFFDTLRTARVAISEIDRVGTALNHLGVPAGKELHAAATALEDCLEVFQRLDGEAVAQRLHDAEQGTANMLAVAIGMARLTETAKQ